MNIDDILNDVKKMARESKKLRTKEKAKQKADPIEKEKARIREQMRRILRPRANEWSVKSLRLYVTRVRCNKCGHSYDAPCGLYEHQTRRVKTVDGYKTDTFDRKIEEDWTALHLRAGLPVEHHYLHREIPFCHHCLPEQPFDPAGQLYEQQLNLPFEKPDTFTLFVEELKRRRFPLLTFKEA